MSWDIRPAEESDLPQINDMVNHFIRHTTVNWSYDDRPMEEALAWFRQHQPPRYPLYVVEQDGQVAAYGCLSPFRPKAGYWPVAENSVYVRPEYKGRGMGKALMQRLIADARQSGLRVITAWVDADNQESITFHERLGFRRVGEMRGIGEKFGRRLSVAILDLDLEENQ